MNMKKIAYIILITVLLGSCGSSGEVVKEARRTINGDWTLTSITYPNNTGTFNVKLFQDTAAECLRNSEWNFISNNNTGSYVPTRTACNAEPRFFIWSVNEVDAAGDNYDLMLKPTDAGNRTTSNNQGFRINLVSLNQDEMVWEHTVTFEGNPFTVRMNFNKNLERE